MTNEELQAFARELNCRGEAYALVTVVCAAALTLGAAATQRAVFNTAF